jgi:GTPase SAR1 family protein
MTATLQKKICMVGAFSVGKTSLTKRFAESIFSETSHHGWRQDRHETVELSNRLVTLILLDLEKTTSPRSG